MSTCLLPRTLSLAGAGGSIMACAIPNRIGNPRCELACGDTLSPPAPELHHEIPVSAGQTENDDADDFERDPRAWRLGRWLVLGEGDSAPRREGDRGNVVLVGHSYAGAAIGEAGNDPKVAALVYVVAFALGAGESAGSLLAQFEAALLNDEIRPDAKGFLKLKTRGIYDLLPTT